MRRLLSPKKRTAQKTASSPGQALIGLRNPGNKYDGTRHNIGYEALLQLANNVDISLGRAPSRVSAEIAQGDIDGQRALLVAPMTFMNESGRAVGSALSYFKVNPGDALLLHDDIDLPFGKLRIQEGGGSGGHNGIRSVERSLGGPGFWRLKIGVGRPHGSMDPADFVLRPFAKSEVEEVELMIADAADVAAQWLSDRERAKEKASLRRIDD